MHACSIKKTKSLADPPLIDDNFRRNLHGNLSNNLAHQISETCLRIYAFLSKLQDNFLPN